MRFGDILEAADRLSIEDQENLAELLHRRVIERRREELALEIQKAKQEHQARPRRPATPKAILKNLLP